MENNKGFTPEELEALKGALSDVENKMGTKAADQIKSHLDVAEKKIAEKYDNEISELKKFKVEATQTMLDNQKWIDEQVANSKKVEVKGGKSALYSAFENHKDQIANYTKNGRRGLTFDVKDFDTKTVGWIGQNSNLSISGTPAFAHGDALWMPGRKPYEVRHIRELCRVVPIPAGMDTYVIRDNAGEGAPTAVALGVAKPQIDRDYVKTVVPITKIAAYFKLPEEYLQDVPWLQEEVTAVGIEELLAFEDSKLLTNAAGGEFSGLNQSFNSTAYSTPASLSGFFVGAIEANNYDVLVAAWTQLRNLKNSTTGVLMHPSDYAVMILAKDTTGNYLFGAPNQSIPNLFGAPIVPHTAVTSDKFFLGDFSKLKVGVRSGLSVRVYDQNEDDAIKNMVTVVLEERITFAADRDDRVIYGDFSDAQAALES